MDILETAAYDRRQRRNMSCTLLLYLLPFFLSAALYFYVWTPDAPPSIMLAGVKSAPTLLLAAVVLSWNGAPSLLGVAGGLISSAVGDACLIWPDLFVQGMAAFAVAHLMYSLTFLSSRYTGKSTSSWELIRSLVLFPVGAAFYIYIYPHLKEAPNSNLIVPGVAVYVLLISLMGALALRTGHTLTILGGLIFIVSDVSLSVQLFNVVPHLQHGNYLVMVTYYLAQLLIAVGDVEAEAKRDEFAKWKSS